MRFLLLMLPKGYETAEPGAMPDAAAVEAMMKYNEELQAAGVLLALDGLHSPSMGARVRLRLAELGRTPSDLDRLVAARGLDDPESADGLATVGERTIRDVRPAVLHDDARAGRLLREPPARQERGRVRSSTFPRRGKVDERTRPLS